MEFRNSGKTKLLTTFENSTGTQNALKSNGFCNVLCSNGVEIQRFGDQNFAPWGRGWSAKGSTFVGGVAGVYALGGTSGHLSLAAGNKSLHNPS